MRPIISALLLMLLATPVVASENRYLDSLWQVYRSSSLDEGSRLLVLHEIVNEVRYEDLDSARTLASEFLRMALSFGQADLIGLAHRDLGNVAAESRDNRSAISHYRKAIAVYATLSDSSAVRGMASSLNNMGIVYKNMGLLDSALAMDRRALAMSMSVGDRTGMMYAYASIARVFEIQGNNDSALFYYERNGTIAEELGDRHTLGGSYGNRANVYERMGRIGPAIDLAYRCLAIFEELKSERSIAISLTTVASLKAELGEVEESLALLRRAHALYTKVGYRQGMMTSGNSIGSNLLELGRTDSALSWLERTLDLEREFDAKDIMANTMNNLAKAYRNEGRGPGAIPLLNEALTIARSLKDAAAEATSLALLGRIALDQGATAQALRSCRNGYTIARTASLLDPLGLNCECLYLAHKARGDGMAALSALEEFNRVQDSVVTERSARELTKRDLLYSFGKEQLADSLRHVNELTVSNLATSAARRGSWIAAAFGLLVVLGLLVFFIIDRQRRRARYEKEAAQLETQALRSQMNPHFIFNALNSINAFVQQNDGASASAYLSKFARLMRLVLENSRQAEVPLKDDIEALDLYLNLELARSRDASGAEKFDYSINVDPSIDQEDTLVPPLVVQPFVENAIWHGMAGKAEKGRITLSVTRVGDDLVMAIEDDGAGRHAKKMEPVPGAAVKKTSLATTITKARLDLVSKQRGRPAGFRYIDLPQGTRVEVLLPLSA